MIALAAAASAWWRDCRDGRGTQARLGPGSPWLCGAQNTPRDPKIFDYLGRIAATGDVDERPFVVEHPTVRIGFQRTLDGGQCLVEALKKPQTANTLRCQIRCLVAKAGGLVELAQGILIAPGQTVYRTRSYSDLLVERR